MNSDEKYMKLALDLAKKGTRAVRTNPKVGAVVVKNNKIIGRGFHKYFGGPHAEVYALRQAGARAKGASLYISLEPCSHWGKTPPCSDAIIQSGIKQVIIGAKDPNPVNKGRGLKMFKKAGIKIKTGVLEKQAQQLNEVFMKYIKTGRPYVIIKAAQTIDGKIATKTGDSRWITEKKARQFSHKLRADVDAIMVGVETILKDDPLLTVRYPEKPKRQPVKVILDSSLRISPDAKIFSKSSPGKVVLATTRKASKEKIKMLLSKKIQIMQANIKDGRVDVDDVLIELGHMGISSVLVEGGGNIIASLLREKLADKAYFFIAPKIIGGKDAVTSVEGSGIAKIKDAIKLRNASVKNIGEDVLIEGYLK